MSKQTPQDVVDSIFKDFDLAKFCHETPLHENEPLTFWLPADYKSKFDLLQKRSKKQFGKLLKEVLKRSIDQVVIDEEPCAS